MTDARTVKVSSALAAADPADEPVAALVPDDRHVDEPRRHVGAAPCEDAAAHFAPVARDRRCRHGQVRARADVGDAAAVAAAASASLSSIRLCVTVIVPPTLAKPPPLEAAPRGDADVVEHQDAGVCEVAAAAAVPSAIVRCGDRRGDRLADVEHPVRDLADDEHARGADARARRSSPSWRPAARHVEPVLAGRHHDLVRLPGILGRGERLRMLGQLVPLHGSFESSVVDRERFGRRRRGEQSSANGAHAGTRRLIASTLGRRDVVAPPQEARVTERPRAALVSDLRSCEGRSRRRPR